MGAFCYNFPDFREIWVGTTKPKLQNPYGAADQNIQTFMSNLGYLRLTRASWIDFAPAEPSNSIQSGHTGTNVAPFPRTNILKSEETGELPIFGNFGRGYLHFCSSPRRKLGCYGLGSTSATIVAHFLRVWVKCSTTFQYKGCFCEHN
jgi:hypothetical protein